MDIQIPFIFVSLFSLASVVLIFIYKFGIKEKSYEEALAEQRQQTHILLGIKPKSKEKKSKKPSKKVQSGVKEKLTVEENDVADEPEQPELSQKNIEAQKKSHVEFKEAAEEVATKTVVSKKQSKKEKVRPILLNKEKIENDLIRPSDADSVSCSSNHFEELQPKDDFELFRSVIAEEPVKDESEKNVSKPENDSKQIKKLTEPEIQRENGLVASSFNGFIGNTGKEKKKKKSEYNTLQQLAGDISGPNMSVLLTLVRKAELSRSEVQILIDLLLNKQHEAPAMVDEWSEGKSDPVQKLKKQLAEKEKLWLEEQQVVINTQAKIREIRTEHQNEKANLLQKIRNMEEMVHNKQLEVARNVQQVQQLQSQSKEEIVKYHKLREEHAALQMQRQQVEIKLGQAQESEVILNQLQTELQELTSMNNQLRMEMAHFMEENRVEKERNQSFIGQLNNFQKELEQKTDRNRQLEETHLQMERDLETFLKQENDFKVDISRLNSVIQQQNEEIRRLEHNTKQYHDDLQKFQDDSSKIIGQLTIELKQAQEEAKQMKLTHMNGSLQENKQHEVEILNLHNELSSVKSQLSQVEKDSELELKSAIELAAKFQREIEDLKSKFDEESAKVEEQKVKNNELREKNWKVMEALNAAEGRIKTKSPTITKSEEDIRREFIQRLFPEITNKEIADPAVFKIEGENFIKKYVDNLRKQDSDDEVQQLKLQSKHFKNVIDDAEKMLNKLQQHIEQEEINWRMQLAAKTAELEAVKESHKQELQEKLTRLEIELKKEQEDKKRIVAQFQESEAAHAQNSSNGVA